MVSLVDSLLDDFDVVDLLTELTERCADLLDVAAAGFLLADPLDQLRLLAATSEQTRELELFSCMPTRARAWTAMPPAHPISVADVQHRIRAVAAVRPGRAEAGFASVHAVPMRAAGIVLGLPLACSAPEPASLNEADLLVGQTLAHVACVAILQEHPPTPATVLPQLRSALTSRIVVEQAKGFLRETPRCFGRRRFHAAAQLCAHTTANT